MERAQAKVAPTDAAGDSVTDVKFIKVGDREYTEQQLQGTLSRYPKANSELMMHKPIIEIGKQLMEQARKQGYDPKPDEVASLIGAAIQAYTKNPQMGGDSKKPQESGSPKAGMSGDESGDDAYTKWEQENAVKLPPGFKENAAKTNAMAAQLEQMTALLTQLVQGGAAGQTANAQANSTMQQAQAIQGDAVTTMITGNLNRAFQQAGLQTDPQSRADFQTFAAHRGYDFPDFVDPEMTATVVADYKAVKDAPEMQRMRDVMARRQAFTGSAESGPGAGGAPAAPAGDPMLAGLISSAMGKRGM